MIRRPHLVGLLALVLLGLSPAAEEKRLAVYSPQTSFAISVIDHDGYEYVSLTDLLDPFGRAFFFRDGKRWRLKFAIANATQSEGEFSEASTQAKLRGKKMTLAHPFWVEETRGYLPLASVPMVLSQMLRMNASLRDSSRRLFLGDVSTTYTTELQKNNPSKLVVHFSTPVNPTIATEPGRVRMTFSHEPIVPGTTNPQNFDDPTIRSATFHEANGAAELVISTTAPVMATFGDNGKTITLAPLKPAVAQVPPPTAEPAPAPAVPTSPLIAPKPVPASPSFTVILDPAHGGSDLGAVLGDGLLEKDVNLAIARRIRNDLEQRGIAATLLRDGDTSLTVEQREITANTSRAAFYICIHASTLGSGVRLYTARVSTSTQNFNSGFLSWDSAQAAFLLASHTLEANLIGEFESRQIPATPLQASLRPLRSIAKPAIAIEVAPAKHTLEGLTSAIYQQSVASAIGSAIANTRRSMEDHR